MRSKAKDQKDQNGEDENKDEPKVLIPEALPGKSVKDKETGTVVGSAGSAGGRVILDLWRMPGHSKSAL